MEQVIINAFTYIENKDYAVNVPDFPSVSYNGLKKHLSSLDWVNLPNDFINKNYTYNNDTIYVYDIILMYNV